MGGNSEEMRFTGNSERKVIFLLLFFILVMYALSLFLFFLGF